MKDIDNIKIKLLIVIQEGPRTDLLYLWMMSFKDHINDVEII